ncbi:hypothetical protein CEK62_08900 [Alcanivorax sp. N3-2A]|nr:hypothetical protein CEK62_08900 [Alcanivorax sp. N3-2A]|tara:strand:- start:5087 stop:6094 length:1008 start_codon:yes stop_codon:yes gene_type:complete
MKGLMAMGAGVVMLALVLIWYALPDQARGRAVPAAAGAASTTPASGNDFQTFVNSGEKLSGMPASLRGTTPDGELREDDGGDLIVSEGVRRRFDYFLSALGEEDLNVIRARIAAHLSKALSPRAAAQAWALFENYLAYRTELRTLPEHNGDVAQMRDSLRARQALRQRWFDAATIEAFFGFEDRYAEFALDRRAILENEQLSEARKSDRLQALTAGLPDDLKEMVNASRRPVRVARQVQTLRAEDASEAEIYQYREQHLGRPAAERLGELDRQRAQWRTRYQAYLSQRQAIVDSGLAREDQSSEIERLRERLFEASELKRVQAMDRIRGRGEQMP